MGGGGRYGVGRELIQWSWDIRSGRARSGNHGVSVCREGTWVGSWTIFL